MGNSWEDPPLPRWRKEGRTGPGPIATRYASRKDRKTVRKGGTVGKDQFGHGGSRRIPRAKIQKSQRGGSHAGGGGGRNDKSCCFAGQAVKAVWAGKFRLARRFARLDVKVRAGRLRWSA